MRRHAAILFDLDGTLADTAPDLAAALNQMLVEDGRPALPFAQLRPWVSWGAMRMIRVGYGEDLDAPTLKILRGRFLACYEAGLCRDSRLFPGIPEVLAALEEAGIPWGIVTNKPGWLTEPLLGALGLGGRAATVISGDTLPYAKPHPLPLLHAAREIAVEAAHCAYVGDNIRDIEAGRAAGMHTVAATWGYIPADDDPRAWQADTLLADPRALGAWLAAPGALAGVA